jgi:polar amino acid transport system substrate-binding protein
MRLSLGICHMSARGDASALLLGRTLKHAQLVTPDSLDAALDMLRTGRADARAAPRPVLLADAAQVPGSRVLEDGFSSTFYAAVVPKDHPDRLAYVGEFMEQAKGSGLVQQSIEWAGLRGIKVAPPAKSN